ncbi:MAG TPA: RDD family protein [Pseudobdellovibrionaceae bacterium]|jgi:uncharacterized RDD family membrane protein YckC
MVIRDLSFSKASPAVASHLSTFAELPLAPVTDRFIALILDFLIFSPVVSFFIASILRNLKTVLLLNSESEEALIIWALFLAGIVVVSSFLQALFMYFWQATPGQKFMQLQVSSYPQRVHQLSFAQCLVRAFGWWGGLLMLGVPFLEILGHPLRRAFHERVSDTIVLSHKQEAADFPLAMETHYVSSVMWVFYGFMLLLGLALMGKTYQAAVYEGLNGRAILSQASCSNISVDKYKDQKRLDLALALYFTDEVDETCVFTEAQKAVWTLGGEEKSLGQLAMALISDDEMEASAYRAKVCEESEKSEACAMSNYLLSEDEDRGNGLRRAGLGLVSSRVLLLKDSMELNNYISAVDLIKDLEAEPSLRSFLDKNMVKAAWALNEKANSQGKSRRPASAEEKDILTGFKKRYDIE